MRIFSTPVASVFLLAALSVEAQTYTFSTLAGVSLVGGGAVDGPGATARFWIPTAVAVDAGGNAYVADTQNNTIRKITPAGVVTTLAGTAGQIGTANGTGASARFNEPGGIAVDAGGNVYVADTWNNAIRKITPAGVVTTLAGVAEPFRGGSEDGPGSVARFERPQGITLDAAGNAYVTDGTLPRIRKITPAGLVSTQVLPSLEFYDQPRGIAVDAAGNLYVADRYNHVVRKLTPAGVHSILAGLGGAEGSADGTGAAARFNKPTGLAIDAIGNLYLADTENHTIRKITPAGTVTTIGGRAGLSGYADGIGSETRFSWPSGVAVDRAGNLYVADSANGAIRKVVVSTPGSSRLINLAIRTHAGSGAQVLALGFVLRGTGTKQLLVRGIGPGLAQFGVPGVLDDPRMEIRSTGPFFTNDNWGGGAALAASFLSVGAFALPAASADAAIAGTFFPEEDYSVQLTGVGGTTGIALAEVYDLEPLGGTARLINVSARAQVGIGADILIAGFVIAGDAPKTLLIRGVGPRLAVFNVPGMLADPRLQIFSGSTLIAENDDWGGTDALFTAFGQTGAFTLSATSKDAALQVVLPPGTYTAQVSGVGGTTGVALVEVYEVP